MAAFPRWKFRAGFAGFFTTDIGGESPESRVSAALTAYVRQEVR
jgi:hypothetical protein